jgi:hypothetical protein
MNADTRRWILLATPTPILAAIGDLHCSAADITPPSEQKSAKGVAEYADEFADAEQSRKPLYEWTLPFTQYVRPPFKEDFSGRMAPPRPKVRLDEESDLVSMKPTPMEQLIERGFPSGESSQEDVFSFTITFSR